MLDNGSVASLQYVSALQDLSSLIRRLIDSSPPTDEPTDSVNDGKPEDDRD